MTEPIRNQLPERRAAKGLSQWDLSRKSGINPGQLSLYETGQRFPRPDAISAIAEVLGEKPATVYEWLTTPASDPEPASVEAAQ